MTPRHFALVFLAIAAAVSVAAHAANPTSTPTPTAAVVGKIYYTNATDASAVCLDGTSGAFYFFPATHAEYADKWIFYMQGGGLCTSPESCWKRAQTPLGSSSTYASELPATSLGGAISRNCTINPEFCHFNLVHVNYCDGFLYSGARDTPFSYQGHEMHLRGKAIREAAFHAIAASKLFGFRDATQLVLTGCSAGALATFMHTDGMAALARSLAPKLTRVKAVPLSGFFLIEPNVQHVELLHTAVKNFLPITNVSADTNQECVARVPRAIAWMCSMAEGVFTVTNTPTFTVNSKTDLWQIACTLLSVPGKNPGSFECLGAPGYIESGCCLGNNFAHCNTTQMNPILSYQQAFLNRMVDVEGFRRPGNGAFISSCFTHCEAMSDWRWSTTSIDGVTMGEAVRRWWHEGSANMPASQHTYLDCARPHTAPYECNPTCMHNGEGSSVAANPDDEFERVRRWWM